MCPDWVSHLLIQCVAGTLGGFTTTILTNPLDIVRARLQVFIYMNDSIFILATLLNYLFILGSKARLDANSI